MLSNAAYFPKTFFTSPILRWILPPAFSAVPRSRKSESPAASPVFSFTFPFASSIRPLILSLVLDFTREESALMRILDVDLGLERLFIFLFYFFPRWVDPGSARLKKGKKVPGEKLCARTRFETAPSLNKFGLLAKREILPTNHTNARERID